MSAQVSEEVRKQEGAALRRLIKERGVPLARVADEAQVKGGASMLSQRMSGGRPIPLEAALRYAKALGVAVDDFSPRLAAQARLAAELSGTEAQTAQANLRPIFAWEHEMDLPEGEFVVVPRLNVRLSAGAGSEQVDIDLEQRQPTAFRAEWIRKHHLSPKRLACMRAKGDSMTDRIQDGDMLVVDTSQVDVVDGRVYALWYEGGERVKRLLRLPGGGLRIASDNQAYAPIDVGATEAERVRIIGRIVHVAGEGGL